MIGNEENGESNTATIKSNNSSVLMDYESYLEHYKNINGFHFTS